MLHLNGQFSNGVNARNLIPKVSSYFSGDYHVKALESTKWSNNFILLPLSTFSYLILLGADTSHHFMGPVNIHECLMSKSNSSLFLDWVQGKNITHSNWNVCFIFIFLWYLTKTYNFRQNLGIDRIWCSETMLLRTLPLFSLKYL